MDCGNAVDIIYLDFSKAFDKVPHDLVINKLAKSGLDGTTLEVDPQLTTESDPKSAYQWYLLKLWGGNEWGTACLLYTSDAADD